MLSQNYFETVLATFCCYDHGANASEEVQKMATDQKENVSQMLLVCYDLLNIPKIYLSINNSEKRFLIMTPPT